MTIQYPVRLERDPDTPEVHIRDASDRIIAAHLIGIIAQEIVDALNLYGCPQRTRKARKQKVEELLRRSDLTAQLTGRDDIEYGHHETLPRGEHVANLGRKK